VLRELFEKIIKWANYFKAIGDAAVQYDPTHASLPWASVRILLQVSSMCGDLMKQISG
jgi:hypothetical protein